MMPTRGFLRSFQAFLVVAIALGLSACPSAQRPAPQPPIQAPAGLEIQERSFPGAKRYRIVGQESLVRILAYRAGTLSGAGHNHLISSRDVHGIVYVHDDPTKSGFDLVMPVGLLEVDNEQLRSEEGPQFAARVSGSAREGTRKNMLSEPLLDGEHHPGVALSSIEMSGTPEMLQALTRVTVKGQEKEVTIPVAIGRQEGKLIATGEFDMRQTDFRITPFSIMLGAVQVADAFKVKFRIVAVEPEQAGRQQ